MGKFVDHLCCVHNGAFLTSADFNGRKDGKEGQVVVVAQKRRKGAPEPEQVVKLTPAADKLEYIKSAGRWLVSHCVQDHALHP